MAENLPAQSSLTDEEFSKALAWVRTADRSTEITPATAKRLSLVTERMQAHLRPATAPEFAVAIDPLVGFCRAFGLEGDPADVVAHWREAVKDMPARIVKEGIADLCRTWKWRKIPLPADLAAACEPHMAERRALLNRASDMLRRSRYRQPDPKPEERADPAVVASLMASLKPTVTDDEAAA